MENNILFGKTLIACGDSFTAGDFSGWHDSDGKGPKESPLVYDDELEMYKTYPWWIAKRNGMKIKNLAKCGGIIALSKEYLSDPENVEIGSHYPFSHETYKNLGDDVDYILIMYGLNDMYHSNLGTINDETNETFYGAFNVVYKYLITKYPYAKIGALVCNAYLSEEYAKAVRETAVKWGIPYLDLMRDTGISTTLNKEGMCDEARKIRNAQFHVSEKNTHPNAKAHELMSTYVEDFLRKI